MKPIKCVTVGDESIEPNELLYTYTTKSPPDEYLPTVFDNYSERIIAFGQVINLQLWNTQGLRDKPGARGVIYSDTDVFILLFSLNNPFSLSRIESIFYCDIQQGYPNVPCILVGTQKGLRDEYYQKEGENSSNLCDQVVSTEQGIEIKEKISAKEYIECDVSTLYNIDSVFKAAIKAALNIENWTDNSDFIKIGIYGDTNSGKNDLAFDNYEGKKYKFILFFI